MKSCPTCNRTFEDTFTFCLIDGSVLSAPFERDAPKSSSARDSVPPPRSSSVPRDTIPTPTEVMSHPPGTVDAGQDRLRPTAPSVPVTTIQAPPPALRARETRETRRATKSNSRAYVVAGVVVFLGVGVVVAISIATRPRTVNRQNLNVGASNTAATNTTTKGGSTLAEAVANKEASLREQIRSDPDNPKLHASLAQLLYVQGRYSESETEAREAIRLNPEYSAPHYTLAFVLEKQNKSAESKAERKRADELASKGQ